MPNWTRPDRAPTRRCRCRKRVGDLLRTIVIQVQAAPLQVVRTDASAGDVHDLDVWHQARDGHDRTK